MVDAPRVKALCKPIEEPQARWLYPNKTVWRRSDGKPFAIIGHDIGLKTIELMGLDGVGHEKEDWSTMDRYEAMPGTAYESFWRDPLPADGEQWSRSLQPGSIIYAWKPSSGRDTNLRSVPIAQGSRLRYGLYEPRTKEVLLVDPNTLDTLMVRPESGEFYHERVARLDEYPDLSLREEMMVRLVDFLEHEQSEERGLAPMVQVFNLFQEALGHVGATAKEQKNIEQAARLTYNGLANRHIIEQPEAGQLRLRFEPRQLIGLSPKLSRTLKKGAVVWVRGGSWRFESSVNGITMEVPSNTPLIAVKDASDRVVSLTPYGHHEEANFDLQVAVKSGAFEDINHIDFNGSRWGATWLNLNEPMTKRVPFEYRHAEQNPTPPIYVKYTFNAKTLSGDTVRLNAGDEVRLEGYTHKRGHGKPSTADTVETYRFRDRNDDVFPFSPLEAATSFEVEEATNGRVPFNPDEAKPGDRVWVGENGEPKRTARTSKTKHDEPALGDEWEVIDVLGKPGVGQMANTRRAATARVKMRRVGADPPAVRNFTFEFAADQFEWEGPTAKKEDADPLIPITLPIFNDLEKDSEIIADADVGKGLLTPGKKYYVAGVIPAGEAADGVRRIVIVTEDSKMTPLTFQNVKTTFKVRASTVKEDEPVPEAKPENPQPHPTVIEPDNVDERDEAAFLASLTRAAPGPGPNFKHWARAKRAFERLLGVGADERDASKAGQYVPGLWVLPEQGELGIILEAGWLVRDGSTMLMGVAGVGKTTFIEAGTRLFCGAPPRLLPHDDANAPMVKAKDGDKEFEYRRDIKSILALPPAQRAIAIKQEMVARAKFPWNGKVDAWPLDTVTFEAFLEYEADKRQGGENVWMVPTMDGALRISRAKKMQKKPPRDRALYEKGTSEHVARAWAIHDRWAAEEPVSAKEEAFFQEVFGSYFDFFKGGFIGLAKSDPEKKPDEILYKTKILKVKYPDASQLRVPDTMSIPQGEAEETVIFPEAQSIVTAPVKFVNETNRMSRAVGDAFLGLMAEKSIEYRGVTFHSPDATWWFDMNPHLGWGTLDWAFLDRIDVSVVIPSIKYTSKMAMMDARFGNRRAQYAATVSDAPEFNMQELQEIWEDVERVDMGDYLPKDVMSDWNLINSNWKYPISAEVRRGAESIAYDPVWWHRISAAMLEHFIATPGYDFTKFVAHPSKGPRAGGDQGEHHKALYDKMVEGSLGTGAQNTLPQNREAIWAKLDRPFGFRAQASLVKFAKAVAWLRGPTRQAPDGSVVSGARVTLDDIVLVLPFVLNHRLQLNFLAANMAQYMSVYDWLTNKPTAQGKGRPDGHMSVIAARVPKWAQALALYYKMQTVHTLLMNQDANTPASDRVDTDAAIAACRKWFAGDGTPGSVSISSLAGTLGTANTDQVLQQIKAEAEALLRQVQVAGDRALVIAIPALVKERRFSASDVSQWEAGVKSGWLQAGVIKRGREEEALKKAIEDAKAYLTVGPFTFHADGDAAEAAFSEFERPLTKKTYGDHWDEFVDVVFSTITPKKDAARPVQEHSSILQAWKGAADASAITPPPITIPSIGKMSVAVTENGSPTTTTEVRTLTIEAQSGQAAKKVREALVKAFKLTEVVA